MENQTFINLSGASVRMRCDMTAHKELWRITGKNLLRGENVLDGITPDNFPNVIHALIRKERQEISPAMIEASIDSTQKMVEALRLVAECINDGIVAGADAENPSRPA